MLLIYFLLLELPVAAIIAVINWLFVLGKSAQSLLMYQHGALGPLSWQVLVPLAVAGGGCYFIGLALRARFDPSRYRGWLKATLGVMAVALLVRVAAGGAM
jgi:hypothetical protein